MPLTPSVYFRRVRFLGAPWNALEHGRRELCGLSHRGRLGKCLRCDFPSFSCSSPLCSAAGLARPTSSSAQLALPKLGDVILCCSRAGRTLESTKRFLDHATEHDSLLLLQPIDFNLLQFRFIRVTCGECDGSFAHPVFQGSRNPRSYGQGGSIHDITAL